MGKKIGISLVCASAIVLFFQNCGKSGFESQDQLDSLTSTASVDSKVSSAPFPWDASVNFVTHMSCPNVNSYQGSNSPYFTFRVAAAEVGAYRMIRQALGSQASLPDIADAGVSFRPEFLDYMDKSFNRNANQATSEMIQSVVTQHPVYKNAQIQLTFRKEGYLDQWGLRGDNSNIYNNVMDKLGSADFAQALADRRGLLVNSFPVRSEAKRNFVGQLHAAAAPASFDDTIFNLTMSRDYFLHIGFSEMVQQAGSNAIIKGIGPVANGTQLYGRGLRFNFGAPNDAILQNVLPRDPLRSPAANPPLAMSKNSITEWDLSTSGGPTQIPGSWSCFSYAIVRAQDATRCPKEDIRAIHRDELEVIRKTLPADEWDVNTTLKCIVPTTYAANAGSCYINSDSNDPKEPSGAMYFGNPADAGRSSLGVIDYEDNLNTANNSAWVPKGVEYRYYKHSCAQGLYRQCVNFASFCYRLK